MPAGLAARLDLCTFCSMGRCLCVNTPPAPDGTSNESVSCQKGKCVRVLLIDDL